MSGKASVQTGRLPSGRNIRGVTFQGVPIALRVLNQFGGSMSKPSTYSPLK